MNTIHSSRAHLGFSLVEILVAMAIGLIIVAAAARIFSTSANTYQVDSGLARLQENGRFAMDFLTRELRMAGDMGCARNTSLNAPPPSLNFYNNVGGTAFDYRVAIQGVEAAGTGPNTTLTRTDNAPAVVTTGWTPGLVATTRIPGAVPGTDALLVRRLSTETVQPRSPVNDTMNVFIAPADAARFQIGEVAVITDCKMASVFQITDIDTTTGSLAHINTGVPGNPCAVWATDAACKVGDQFYNDEAEIARIETTVFFIGLAADNTPTLFSGSFTGGGIQVQPLVPGVENMQILYGVDTDTALLTDGDPDVYLTAAGVNELPAATGWPRVVSVRLSLLLRTVDLPNQTTETTQDTGSYILTGATPDTGTTIVVAPDRQRRRVFNTTIRLRNRGG